MHAMIIRAKILQTGVCKRDNSLLGATQNRTTLRLVRSAVPKKIVEPRIHEGLRQRRPVDVSNVVRRNPGRGRVNAEYPQPSRLLRTAARERRSGAPRNGVVLATDEGSSPRLSGPVRSRDDLLRITHVLENLKADAPSKSLSGREDVGVGIHVANRKSGVSLLVPPTTSATARKAQWR